MTDAPEEHTRSWGPLLAAAGVGAVVLIGAIVAFVLAGGPDEREAAVIAACEAEQAEAGGAAIVAGDVYDPTEWRDHYSTVGEHDESLTPLDDLPADEVQQREARAEAYVEEGDGTFVIVWRLEDDAYVQCTAPLVDGAVETEDVTVGALQAVPTALTE